jgi:co-chaperonin GroES (HSP10)
VKSQEERYLNTATVATDKSDDSVYLINGERFQVCGTKIAIHLYVKNSDSVSKGGIITPGNVRNREAIDSPVGRVVAMGSDAYKDKLFSKPYCKVGDWVVFPRSAITRMNWDDIAQIVFAEDTSIISTVPYPEGIERAIPIDRF